MAFFCARSLHSGFVLGLTLMALPVSTATGQILSSHVLLWPPYWAVRRAKGVFFPPTLIPQFLKDALPSPPEREFCGQVSGGNSGFIRLNVSLEQNFLEPNRLMCIVTLQEKYTVCSTVRVHMTSQVRNPGTRRSVCWRRSSKKLGGRWRWNCQGNTRVTSITKAGTGGSSRGQCCGRVEEDVGSEGATKVIVAVTRAVSVEPADRS